MAVSDKLARTVTVLILAVPATRERSWPDQVAALAALIAEALSCDPAAPASIAVGLRRALEATLADPDAPAARTAALAATMDVVMAEVETRLDPTTGMVCPPSEGAILRP